MRGICNKPNPKSLASPSFYMYPPNYFTPGPGLVFGYHRRLSGESSKNVRLRLISIFGSHRLGMLSFEVYRPRPLSPYYHELDPEAEHHHNGLPPQSILATTGRGIGYMMKTTDRHAATLALIATTIH